MRVNVEGYDPTAYIIEKDGIIVKVNKEFCELTGYNQQDLLNTQWNIVAGTYLRSKELKKPTSYIPETYIFTKSLEAICVSVKIMKYNNETKYVFHEIPHSRFEEKNQFVDRLLTDNITGIGIYRASDFMLIKANQTYLNYLPKPFNTKEMVYGKTLEEFIQGFVSSSGGKIWRDIAENNKSVYIKEKQGLLLDGDKKYWDNTITPIVENGKVKYIVSMLDDVSERVLSREKMSFETEMIKMQKKDLESIIDGISDGLIVLDKNGKVIKVNHIIEGSTNNNSKDILALLTLEEYGNQGVKLYQQDGKELPLENFPFYRVLRGETVKNHRIILDFGSNNVHLDYNATPIFDQNGELQYIVITCHDVTELILKDKEIRERQEDLKIITDYLTDAVFILNVDGSYRYMNKRACDMVYEPNGLKCHGDSMSKMKYYYEDGKELTKDEQPGMRALRGEYLEDIMLKTVYEDKIKYYRVNAKPIYSPKGKLIFAMLCTREVTDIVEIEKRVNEQKEQLQAIIENMSDALLVFDSKYDLVITNKAAKSIFSLFSTRTLEGLSNNGYMLYGEDGNVIPEPMHPLVKIRKGEAFTEQSFCIQLANGELKHFNISGTPIYNEAGKFSYGVLCCREMTERVKHEQALQEIQMRLLIAEKERNESLENAMKHKDEFLYLITHEFKTPIAVISSALQTMDLLFKDELPVRVVKFLNTIKQNTNRQLRLVNNLLDITRINAGHVKLNKSIFDIVFVTQAIINSVQVYAQQKQISLNFSTTLDTKEIYIDEEKYERILLNLISNSLKFTPSGKSIEVKIFEKKYKKRNMICISVKDEGIGIPKDKQEHIFEKFGQADTSLSRHAEGTGIGLNLVKLLINAFDGEILLDSEEGKGSDFTVMLPIVKATDHSEIAAAQEEDFRFMQRDTRLIHAVAIEFSDIYF